MDDESRMRQLRIASQQYEYAVSKLPYPGAFEFLHPNLAELVEHNFHVSKKPWLNSYELASVANYIALYGSTSRKPRPSFDIGGALKDALISRTFGTTKQAAEKLLA